MRKFLMRVSILAGAVLTLGGCTDSPTQPEQHGAPDLSAPSLDEQAQGCVSDGYCVLPPISGGGGECDPTITECDDGGWDSCATSAPGTPDPEMSSAQSCPGGGGGGAGGDGGWGGGDGGGGSDPRTTEPCVESTTGECPDDPALPDTWDDEIGQDTLPNCTNTATWTKPWHAPYCNGSAPTGATLTAFNAEMSAMEAKGGVCAELARFGRLLLAQGMVRYYTSSGATAKSWGGAGIGIIMDDAMIGNSPPYDHGWALAHELEHAYSGYIHPPDGSDRDVNGVSRTPSDSCG